jgi:hypothetical protein
MTARVLVVDDNQAKCSPKIAAARKPKHFLLDDVRHRSHMFVLNRELCCDGVATEGR